MVAEQCLIKLAKEKLYADYLERKKRGRKMEESML